MRQPNVAVIDYGIGNLLSVRRALEHCGAVVTVTSDPDVILSASKVVLPGVGAFADAMNELCRLKLDSVVKKVAARGTPLMGICLGMQMLLDESGEFGKTAGLGLIPGRVVPLPIANIAGQTLKVPHIGWNELVLLEGRRDLKGTLLQDLKSGDTVYFVHSFMATPQNSDHRIADCMYGSKPVSAVIANDNVIGCQFHPEKSGEVGLNVFRRFLLL
jgi:glutamine amidotransferase